MLAEGRFLSQSFHSAQHALFCYASPFPRKAFEKICALAEYWRGKTIATYKRWLPPKILNPIFLGEQPLKLSLVQPKGIAFVQKISLLRPQSTHQLHNRDIVKSENGEWCYKSKRTKTRQGEGWSVLKTIPTLGGMCNTERGCEGQSKRTNAGVSVRNRYFDKVHTQEPSIFPGYIIDPALR